MQRHQQQVITYLHEKTRVLKAQLGSRRLRLTDTERRRLAALAYPLGRKRLQEVATVATPDTLLRWYHRLIAQKFDGSTHRTQRGRPEVLAATDFFTVEVATWHGLVTYDVLVVMELATRRVQVAGMTPHPTDAFMMQCARQLTDPFDGFLLGKRYMLHDRDTKFMHGFDRTLQASGVEPVVLPPRSPNLHAFCERFVRSIREEALNQMLLLSENSLHVVIQHYLEHYHQERHHQGLDNQLIAAEPGLNRQSGLVVRRERLGGLLSYDYREAA